MPTSPLVYRIECAHHQGPYDGRFCPECDDATFGPSDEPGGCYRSLFGLLDDSWTGSAPAIRGWWCRDTNPHHYTPDGATFLLDHHLFGFPSWGALLRWFPDAPGNLDHGPHPFDAPGWGLSVYRVTRRRTRPTFYRCPSGTQCTFDLGDATLLARHRLRALPRPACAPLLACAPRWATCPL